MGLCLHCMNSRLSFSHLTPREIDCVKCKCSCCITFHIRHIWCFCEDNIEGVWFYFSYRLCAPVCNNLGLVLYFSVGVLTRQPPQPGNRCVSEPLISILGWRLGNDHWQVCLMLQLCRWKIWSKSRISSGGRGTCWFLSRLSHLVQAEPVPGLEARVLYSLIISQNYTAVTFKIQSWGGFLWLGWGRPGSWGRRAEEWGWGGILGRLTSQIEWQALEI